ncbi:response regulator, partial [Proteus mirabilis]
LPLAYDDWARGPRKAARREATVLLVDDSAFFREMLTPVLKAAGYAVVTAESAEKGLAALKANARIDVVVTDLEMPNRSGLEFIADMRKGDPRLAAMPVVALSSALGADMIDRAKALAVTDLVAKFDRSG